MSRSVTMEMKNFITNNANYSHVHYVVTDRTIEFAISLVLVVRLKKNLKKIEQDSRLVSLAQRRIKTSATKCKIMNLKAIGTLSRLCLGKKRR